MLWNPLHHTVEKDSTTTQLWIVFDCSFISHPTAPACLNDCLLISSPCDSGSCLPFLFISVCIALEYPPILRKRSFMYVFILMKETTQTFSGYLIQQTPQVNSGVHYFEVVPFGATSLTFMLKAVLPSPQATQLAFITTCVLKFYVDNIITGCDVE